MGIPWVRYLVTLGLGDDFELGGDPDIVEQQQQMDGVAASDLYAPPLCSRPSDTNTRNECLMMQKLAELQKRDAILARQLQLRIILFLFLLTV